MGKAMSDPIFRKACDILLQYQFIGKEFMEDKCNLLSSFNSNMPSLYSQELSLKMKNYFELNKFEMKEMILSLDLLVVALPDNIKQTFPYEIQKITSLLRQRYARQYKESPYLR